MSLLGNRRAAEVTLFANNVYRVSCIRALSQDIFSVRRSERNWFTGFARKIRKVKASRSTILRGFVTCDITLGNKLTSLDPCEQVDLCGRKSKNASQKFSNEGYGKYD